MAYASVTYTSASGTTFALTNDSGDPIPYLRQADISVTVNGVLQVQGTDYTFNTAGTSIILSSSVSGATVIISRVTDITDATVVYTPGSTLTAQDLNNADNQIRYGLQEFSDTYDALTTGTGDLEVLGGFIGSNEAWVADNAHAATTGAIDGRIDGKIDTALTTDVVAGDSITVADNSPSSGQITIGVTDASITTAKLVDSSVTTAKIADSNVTTVKIANSNVTTAKIADANVTNAKIADSAITSVKIADGTIVAGDIASDAVTTAKILDSNVTTAKIADSAVTTTKINDSAVTAVKIADGVITSAKLNASTVVTAAEQAASTPDDTSFFTTSASDARYVNVTGDSMTGALAMGSNKITGLDTPTASGDAATKGYVDGLVASATLADADYGDITVSGTGTVWTIDNSAVTSAKIADDTIVNADINTSAAIAHSKLADITAGSVLLGNASNVPTATALSGDVTVNSSGVTAIGSGVIVDADISASAEIAVSKLADGAARQLLQTDAAGTGVEWTSNVDVPGTLDVTGNAVFDSALGVGGDTTGVVAGVTVTSKFCVKQEGTSPVGGFVHAENSSATTGSGVFACRSRGTLASPLIVQNNDRLASLFIAGHDGVDLALAAEIDFEVDGSPGSNNMPGRIIFRTTPSGDQSPVERLRIDSSGRVGIGVTAPSFTNHIKQNTTYGFGLESNADDSRFLIGNVSSTWRVAATYGSTGSFQPITFFTSDLERARLDTSGRLLVGTSSTSASTSAVFQGYGGTPSGPALVHLCTGTATPTAELGYIIFGNSAQNEGASITAWRDGGTWTSGSSHPSRLVFSTTADGASSPTERMRISNQGDLSMADGRYIYVNGNGDSPRGGLVCTNTSNNTTATVITFKGWDGSTTGTITTRVNVTAYNTSSDYRLKENIVDLEDAASRIKLLKPKRFNFTANPDETLDGFLAHEAQLVVPEAVSGYKDQVDAEGNPVHQGVDLGKFVPLLTAALQEALAEIDVLKAKVAALESA